MHCRVATRQDIRDMHRIRMAVKENVLNTLVLTEDDYIPEIEETGRGWVIEEQNKIVAFGVANKQTSSIWALFVEPSSEGQGFGQCLLNQMIDWLWEQGITRIHLSSEPGTRAEQFYLKAGWIGKELDQHGDRQFELTR